MKSVGQVGGTISTGSLRLGNISLTSNSDSFGHQFEMVASNRYSVWVGLMALFRVLPNSESLLLPVDVHASPGGQSVIAQIFSRRPLDGGIPALARCASQHSLAREH